MSNQQIADYILDLTGAVAVIVIFGILFYGIVYTAVLDALKEFERRRIERKGL